MKRKSMSVFLVLWAGQLLSSLGTGMTGFALGVYVFEETSRVSSFALLVSALFIPAILLRPAGGVLADRMDRRILIILGDLGSAAGVVIILLHLKTGTLTPGIASLCVAFSSAFTALQNPAYKASLTDLLDAQQYARAGGLVQLASSAQHLLAPLGAGFLLAAAGLDIILLLDIASFLVAVTSAFLIPGIHPDRIHTRGQGFIADMGTGLACLRRKRQVMETVILLSLVTFFVGMLQVLFGPMMLSLFDPVTLGMVQAVSASGMLAGSVLIGFLGLPQRLDILIAVSLGTAGIFLGMMGCSTGLVWISVNFFLFFFCLPFINTGAEVLIRTAVPNAFQGRVWGLIGFITQTGYIIAYVCAGSLADHVFNPLLLDRGFLAPSVGRLTGTGPGRGIALMLILAGSGLAVTAWLVVLRWLCSIWPARLEEDCRI
jgi:MFS transporter, DHA3 family, macrolide efflux protein